MPEVIVKEGQAEILFPTENEVFYNKIQTWYPSIELTKSISVVQVFIEKFLEESKTNKKIKTPKTRVSILEALAASGLRSIRYAKEIEKVDKIVCNDFDPAAVESIKKNVAHNQLEHLIVPSRGDANFVMYKALSEKETFDVIDLDPYGTASPFIDASIRSVSNGGLLCVTCTDMACLAGAQLESCFAKYGGQSIPNAPFVHEMGLRILLYQLHTTAARYGKYIKPLLSLSIDFYVRVFVRVFESANERKKAASQTGIVHYCKACKSFYTESLGKMTVNGKSVKHNTNKALNSVCTECDSQLHFGGPFYLEPIHDPVFLGNLKQFIAGNTQKFKTHRRMLGMVTSASEELPVPLFYTLPQLCSSVHCTPMKMELFVSALLNRGFKVSASHAQTASIKTDAPPKAVWDIMREWVAYHPINPERPVDFSTILLAKDAEFVADFTIHKDSKLNVKDKSLVRYQVNPEANWGPKAKARGKRAETEEEEKASKRIKQQS